MEGAALTDGWVVPPGLAGRATFGTGLPEPVVYLLVAALALVLFVLATVVLVRYALPTLIRAVRSLLRAYSAVKPRTLSGRVLLFLTLCVALLGTVYVAFVVVSSSA